MYFSTQKLGSFRKFCVKSNLTLCKVTFICKLQKKIGGAGLGGQLLPLHPGSRACEPRLHHNLRQNQQEMKHCYTASRFAVR